MNTYNIAIVIALLSPSLGWASVNKNAPKGGHFIYNITDGEPATVNPIHSGEGALRNVMDWACGRLGKKDLESGELIPYLAESWTESKDKLSIVFKLRDGIYFHDGTPVTAEDVQYSFEIIRNVEANAAPLIPLVESIKSIDVLNAKTVQFKMKEVYFLNLPGIVLMVNIVPKHIYNKNKNFKTMNSSLVCSGPYQFVSWDKGQKLSFKKAPQWFGDKVPQLQGLYNFDTLTFKFLDQGNIAKQHALKGNIDFSEIVTADVIHYTSETFQSNQVKFFKISNKEGKYLSYYGFNFRRPVMQSRAVRLAMAHLYNAEEFNKKLRGGLSDLSAGPYDSGSPYFDKRKPIKFDPKLAKEILKNDGWADTNKDGILDKVLNGKRADLQLKVIYPHTDHEKYLTPFADELLKAGIKLNMQYIDGARYWKLLEQGDFDMWAAVWGPDEIGMDPKQIYHSTSAGNDGSNYGGYKNQMVDELIDQGRKTVQLEKRIPLFKKAGTLIADDLPYIFLFDSKYKFYIRSNRIKAMSDSQNYGIGFETWWSADAEAAAAKR